MRVISLGWGVQSFTLAAMCALGSPESVDVAIHADTLHESKLTYLFAERWTPWLEERGVRVVTIRGERQRGVADKWGGVFIPAFTYNGKTKGMLRRQCTGRWKIAPIRRWLQANRNGIPVELWVGISTDEALRMKMSDVKYITNRWPLIEKGMSRLDCKQWLRGHGLEVPPKSACTFCPFHDRAEWRQIRATPEDWREAVSVDRAIRKMRPPHDLYVHLARIPLEDVDLRTDDEMGQIRLWDEECFGVCGV